MKIKKQQEYILCAAIHYNDGKQYKGQPYGINTGFVISGRRHNNCFELLEQILSNFNSKYIHKNGMGFMTSSGYFVDRKVGYKIAEKAGQLLLGSNKPKSMQILTSEDLYYDGEGL